MRGAKLFSKMLSGGQNPQLHTVTLHLVCGIRNEGGDLKSGGGLRDKKREGYGVRERQLGWRDGDEDGEEVRGRNISEKETNRRDEKMEAKC